MEWLTEYGTEIAIGGSSTVGGFIVAILKAFSKRLKGMEDKIATLEKEIAVNTALDKQRNHAKR